MKIKKILTLICISQISLSYSLDKQIEQNKLHQDIINACVTHKNSEFIASIIKEANKHLEHSSENKKLIEAIINNDLPFAQDAIKNDADVNQNIGPNLDMLKAASVLGCLEIVKLLLISNVNVNAKNRSNSTALMYAAIAGKFDIVKLLIQSGADITITDNDGDTAVTSAGMAGYTEIEKFLSDKINDANQNRKDIERTFLLSAKREDSKQLEDFIKNGNVDIDCKDSQGWTALNYAIANKQQKNLRLLLDASTKNINFQNDYGRTPLKHAIEEESPEMVEILCRAKADVNYKPGNYNYSCFDQLLRIDNRKKCFLDILKILVCYGLNIDYNLLITLKIRSFPASGYEAIASFLENDAFKLQTIHKDGVVKRVLKDKLLQATPLTEDLANIITDYSQTYDLPKEEVNKFFYSEDQFELL